MSSDIMRLFYIYVVFGVTVHSYYCQVEFPENIDERNPSTFIKKVSSVAGSEQRIVFPPGTISDAERHCVTQNGKTGVCKQLVHCITIYSEVYELRRQNCTLTSGQLGVCCPLQRTKPVLGNKPVTGILGSPTKPNIPIFPLNREELNHACTSGLHNIQRREEFESELFASGIIIESGTPAASHQEFFITNEETLQFGKDALKTVEASMQLVHNFKLSPDQGKFSLPNFSILDTVIEDTCPRPPICPETKYRTADGSCNNRIYKDWGRAKTAFQRILPPKYDDGINSPRRGGRQELPSPRAVSTSISRSNHNNNGNYTILLMQWGQFLDHDLTHTPIVKGKMKSGIKCCMKGDFIEERFRHPDCFPISIPRDDTFFSLYNQKCMEFVRSLPAPRPECNFGPREQMNQISAFIDGSSIYSSDAKEASNLREGRGGQLKVQRLAGRDLLPANPEECADHLQKLYCFKAGDSRANEQVQLTLMHTLWVREHNRIVAELSHINPGWGDEVLYQETRRIVVAELQHITYQEFLPLVLGTTYMHAFQLFPKKDGYTRLYNESINPTITNVFATAAYRYGHSQIQSYLQGYNKFGFPVMQLPLHEYQFSPYQLYKPGAVDAFIRGLTTQSSQKSDRFFSSELTDHLFQTKNTSFGLDLLALNIQRGRDHGLLPYNEWREICQLSQLRRWEDLQGVMEPQVISKLRQLYGDVNEIDLFVGSISEHPLPDALLGPTFVCLIGDQFARLRRGDRFFYEEENQASSFSKLQLKQIRKASLARILCDNSDDIALVQPHAFLRTSFQNKKVPCDSDAIPVVDLTPWRNEPVWQ